MKREFEIIISKNGDVCFVQEEQIFELLEDMISDDEKKEFEHIRTKNKQIDKLNCNLVENMKNLPLELRRKWCG